MHLNLDSDESVCIVSSSIRRLGVMGMDLLSCLRRLRLTETNDKATNEMRR